jgi:DGQHR domain-containing protein
LLQIGARLTATISISGIIGRCGDRDVFIGFAPASILAQVSFADLLDEGTGKGYQRRFHREHSLEFKKYIQQPNASTIPLTFNLRPDCSEHWRLERNVDVPNAATLMISDKQIRVMAQVDCQHRLGYLGDSSIPFAFMTFIGLTVAEEMEIFRVINGKAKGLSGSLLDFTEARLAADNLSAIKPELYVALRLHEEPQSPWYQRLDLGGKSTVGTKRQASLRTMQNGAKRFLREAQLPASQKHDMTVRMLIDFWTAVSMVLPKEWAAPRAHMLTKGIGVYSLMRLAGVLVREAQQGGRICNLDYFISKLSDFLDRIDWSNRGPLHGYGGTSGADAVLALLLQIRSNPIGASISYGKQEHPIN